MSQLMMKRRLTLEMLKNATRALAEVGSVHLAPSSSGITDGKTRRSTYALSSAYRREWCDCEAGDAPSGIDFPKLMLMVRS